MFDFSQFWVNSVLHSVTLMSCFVGAVKCPISEFLFMPDLSSLVLLRARCRDGCLGLSLVFERIVVS